MVVHSDKSTKVAVAKKNSDRKESAITRQMASDKTSATAEQQTVSENAYIPSDQEKYMSVKQLRYFKRCFEEIRVDIVDSTERLIDAMKGNVDALPDENDRASKESEFTVELREREREQRLLSKIDLALSRIEKKEFGYCQECGENIGIERLLARPVATLCFECKNMQEEFEKSGGTSSSI